ncbi:MAG TPA: PQQ-binding-like beta-propeller repeat protein [Acidimicrobiia bacterium]|nr:PQQ-binding-like beta-propeller repeat protein [Acidimicrobiia bacterium]
MSAPLRYTSTLVAVIALAACASSGAETPKHGVHHTPTASVARTSVPEPTWSTSVPGWPSALVADDRTAVVIAGTDDVIALDPTTGDTKWHTHVPGSAELEPALGDDQVIVPADNRAVALERATGAARWSLPLPARVTAVAIGTGAGAGTVLLATDAGELRGVDAHTGATIWSSTHDGVVHSQPALDPTSGSFVTVWHRTDRPMVRASDALTGAERWSAPTSAQAAAPTTVCAKVAPIGTPIAQTPESRCVDGGAVIVASGDGNSHAAVVAYDIRTGAERWRTAVPKSFESAIHPVAVNGLYIVVDHFGTVTALDPVTGARRWRRMLDRPVLHTRLVAGGGVVAFTDESSDLIELDQRSGRTVYAGDPGGSPVGIARAGARLLVALRITEPGRVEARTLR